MGVTLQRYRYFANGVQSIFRSHDEMMVRRQVQVSALITDLDNTLWDWVHIWYSGFTPMLEELVRITSIDRETLEREIRTIHQLRGTSEYSHLLQELPSLKTWAGKEDFVGLLEPAIDAYRAGRRESMRLYPTVLSTLTTIRNSGCKIIAYTESKAYYTNYRIRKFGLDGIIDVVYSPADHDFPDGVSPEQLRTMPHGYYDFQSTEHRLTPSDAMKPDRRVLETIITELKLSRSRIAYVGDSLTKDVSMAQEVGVIDVYAQYGLAQHSEEYQLLRKVTHWSNQDVERERELLSRPLVTPSYTLQQFGELLEMFSFTLLR